MSGHRFFFTKEREEQAYISGEEFTHLQRVLRLSEGDEVIALDGEDGAFSAVIATMEKDCALLRLQERLPSTEAKTRVTVYQALPKGDKLDLILQKCTEIGAAGFALLATKNSVSRPKDMAKKMPRYQRIIREAAKQSGRTCLPNLRLLDRLEEARERTLFFLDEEGTLPLSEALVESPEALGIAVGPEGGWDPAERAWLSENGAIGVSLGPRILRTETAALAALSAILFAMGDLGG